jgi:hypothetical protein
MCVCVCVKHNVSCIQFDLLTDNTHEFAQNFLGRVYIL